MSHLIILFSFMEWGAIAAGAAVLVGSIINLFSTHSTNKAQKEMMEEQNAFNEQMQDKQNEYNSPANQRRLYQEAGIPSSFLFGGQSGLDSTSSLASGAGVPSLQAPQFDGSGVADALFNSKRVQNETLKNEADIKKTIEESKTYQIANSQAEERFKAEIAKIKGDTSLTEAQRDKSIQEAKTEKLRQQEVYYNAENLKYNIDLIKQRASTEKWSQQKMEAEISRIIKLTPFEVQNIQSQSSLNAAQSKVAAESLNKIQQEVVNMIKQGDQIDAVTLSTIIDNEVKHLKSSNEISAELLKSESPVLNLIYQNTNGMIGDIIKSIGAFSTGVTTGDNKNSHHQKVVNKQSSSWMFNK